MKEAVVNALPEFTVEIHDVPIPTAGPDEVVIKVVAAGSNVKDWAHIIALKISINSGDDIAGIVYSIGSNVNASGEFSKGDRVAAFHPMLTPHGAYAEYAVAPAHTVFLIPQHVGFEEAATIPLVSMTAAISLFRRQSLPPPWFPLSSKAGPVPLVIYGASSALGCFAIKLAKVANIHPIIAICGGSYEYAYSLLDADKGDVIVDYRRGTETMIREVREALGKLQVQHALDAISSNGTWIPLAQLIGSNGGQLSVVSGANRYDEPELGENVEIKYTYVGTAHYGSYKTSMPKQPKDQESVENDVDFAYLFFRYLARLLSRREIEGHPFEVIPGGLRGVQVGLQRLKEGKAAGRKFVYRIEETER